MGTLTSLVLPFELKPIFPLLPHHHHHQKYSILIYRRRRLPKKHQYIAPVARLFGQAIFEASKLKVLFLGIDEKHHPGKLPRTYTLTHCDITSKLTLAISQTINNSQLQGWYNRLQRDEVVAEWKKVKGKMSLHVHCHISGGHFLLDLCARLRYFIFSKELPMVLKAFVHGDGNLFTNYPELQEALAWVYFHSNIPEFNKVECWGPLKDAAALSSGVDGVQRDRRLVGPSSNWQVPRRCQQPCRCCFSPMNMMIHWPHDTEGGSHQTLQQQKLGRSNGILWSHLITGVVLMALLTSWDLSWIS